MMRIVRALAPNPGVYTLDGTNTWIVGANPAIVIDPGPDDVAHLSAVRADAGAIGAILVTHAHEDHAAGALRLSRDADATVYAYRAPEDGQRVRDGAEVTVGSTRVQAMHTPGHTPDHVAFYLPQVGALFTGDAVLGRGTSVIDPPEGDLVHYLRSLERMRELGARVIYPGHGPTVFDAHGKLDEYLAHRAERESQILAEIAAAGKAGSSVDMLVGSIYVDYPADVRPLAARSVVAHLKKLEDDGLVTKQRAAGGDVYSLAPEPKACERCGRPFRGRSRLCNRCAMVVLQEGPTPTTPTTPTMPSAPSDPSEA